MTEPHAIMLKYEADPQIGGKVAKLLKTCHNLEALEPVLKRLTRKVCGLPPLSQY